MIGLLLLTGVLPAEAGCRVIEVTDPVHDVTTRAVHTGKVAPGVYLLVGVNDKPSAEFPSHVVSITIQRTGMMDLFVTKHDPAVLVHHSGAKTELMAFKDATRQRSLQEYSNGNAQLISTWSVSYVITGEQLDALVSDPIVHIEIGFGDQRMPIPIKVKKAKKAAAKLACLQE